MTRILAVDMGNTFTKYALIEDGQIKSTWRHATADTQTAADAVLSQCDAPLVLSSVVPVAAAQLEQLCVAKGRPLHKVSAAQQTIVTCSAGELGADLLAGAVAARKLYAPGKDLIVVGLGTANTLVRIRANGLFDGCRITDGLTPVLEDLAKRCALVPEFAIEDLTDTKPGFNTKDAVLGGTFLFLIGGIKEWVADSKTTLGADAVTVGTGGWATTVAQHAKVFDHVDPELVLKGIYFLGETILQGTVSPSVPTPTPSE